MTQLPLPAQADVVFGSSDAEFPLSGYAPIIPIHDGMTGARSPEIKEFPPLPSSMALFLSGMVSVGAWHAGRSVRHLHLSHLPEWYHSGGPAQVGQAVPFDFDFSAAPLCCFEQPVGVRPFLYRVQRENTPRVGAQCFLLITAPRGPPLLS